MSKVNRFSLEERYGYQNRKVIYDKDADNDIELNSIYPIIDLLNQLDEQIPDLQHRLEVANKMGRDAEKENQQLKALLKATEVTDIHNELADLQINNEWLESENQQLKQQLHDLPKKIVCEISEAIERLSWRKRIYTNWEFDKEQLYKDLDTILKKYGGEDE